LRTLIYKTNRYFWFGLMVGLLLLISVQVAYAGSASGSKVGASGAGGYVYTAYNRINTSTVSGTKQANGSIYIEEVHPMNVPSGYMGGLPRVYNGIGFIVKEGTWSYNSGPAFAISTPVIEKPASGERYAKGQFKIWGGSSYTTYATLASPSQTSY
jgi:hypothetical protein